MYYIIHVLYSISNMGVHCHLQIEETGDSPRSLTRVHTARSGYRGFWRVQSMGFPALNDNADQTTVFSRAIIFSSPCASNANAVHYAVLWHKWIIIITSNVIIAERRRLSSRAQLVSGSRVFGWRVSRNIVILIYYCIYIFWTAAHRHS